VALRPPRTRRTGPPSRKNGLGVHDRRHQLKETGKGDDACLSGMAFIGGRLIPAAKVLIELFSANHPYTLRPGAPLNGCRLSGARPACSPAAMGPGSCIGEGKEDAASG
jgi:hypothetical protein